MRLFRSKKDPSQGPQLARAATLQPKACATQDNLRQSGKADKLLRSSLLGTLKSIHEDDVLADDDDDDSASDFSAKIPSGSFDDSCSQSSDSFEDHTEALRMHADLDSADSPRHASTALTESARWGELFDEDEEAEGSSTSSDDTGELVQLRQGQTSSGHATLLPRRSSQDLSEPLKQKPDSPNSVLIGADSTAAGTALQCSIVPARDIRDCASDAPQIPRSGSLSHLCQQTQHALSSMGLACSTSPAKQDPQPAAKPGRCSADARRSAERSQACMKVDEPYCGKGGGLGACTFENGDCYQGRLQDGLPHGLGVHTFVGRGTYAGQWQRGMFSGHGVESFADGAMHVGCYIDGAAHGLGICQYQNGSFYEGQFQQGLPQGRGMHKCKDGSSFVGSYNRGQRSGQGVYLFSNGDRRVGAPAYCAWVRYMGMWQSDVPAGLGCYYLARGGMFAGQFSEGVKDGWGVSTAANGLQFAGRWSEGTCMWQSSTDPRDASQRPTDSQLHSQRMSTARTAADRARVAAEQGLQLVQSHLQDVRDATKRDVLRAQDAATAAEDVQVNAAAASKAFRHMTGASEPKPMQRQQQWRRQSMSQKPTAAAQDAAELPQVLTLQRAVSGRIARTASAASSISAREDPADQMPLNPILTLPRQTLVRSANKSGISQEAVTTEPAQQQGQRQLCW